MEEYAVDPAPKAKMMTRAASSEVYVVNFRTKESAVTNYNEYGTGDAGYTNGAYGADAAYLGTSGGKVKFMMSGVVGLVKESEVEVIKYSDAKVVSGYYCGRRQAYARYRMQYEDTGL